MEVPRVGYERTRRLLRRYAFSLLGAGTVVLAGSLLWNQHQRREAILEIARSEARSAIAEDNVFRQWNAEHGGVYVDLGTDGEPDPDFVVLGRAERTESGRSLQLVHHVGMTRMAQRGRERERPGGGGRITSLSPLRKHNAPSPWEREALRALDGGLDEVSVVQRLENDEEIMYLMRPLRTEADCLRCHGTQGYRVGDVRGGVAFAVPLAPLQAISVGLDRALLWAHVGLWLLGGICLGLGFRALTRSERRRWEAEEARREALDTAAARNLRLTEQGHALSIQRHNLETLLARMSEGVVLLDAERRVAITNAAADRLLASDGQTLRGRSLANLFPVDGNRQLRTMFETACRQADANQEWSESAQGRDHVYTVTTVPAAGEATLGVLGIVQDLSPLRSLEAEQKALQEQLYEMEKLAIVGILAGSLARELNTPLGTILVEAQRLRPRLDDRGSGDPLRVVEEQVHACRDTVRRLLEFSQVAGARPVAIDLREPVEALPHLVDAGLRLKGVALEIDVEDGVPRVQADAKQIEQVLMNLIWNAADAMPDGGSVQVRLHRSKDGAEIQVRDRGVGIPHEYEDKIFEPFFTTKPTGKGTGLGLAICRRIVEEHHGQIAIAAREGGGTLVCLTFPAVGEHAGWRSGATIEATEQELR